MDWTIRAAEEHQAGEVLTVQRAAYVTEAQLYDNPHLSALTETLEQVRVAIAAGQVLVAVAAHRVVGAVRGVLDGGVCHVGRLVVAPDVQGRGVGAALLRAVERGNAGAVRFTLFTGDRSVGNLRLYRKAGYTVARTEQVSATLALIHLDKAAHIGCSIQTFGST